MIVESIDVHRESSRKWRERNKEKVLEYGRQYRKKHKRKMNKQSLVYYYQHKEKILKYGREYAKTHREQINHTNRIWLNSHPERRVKYRKRARAWYKRNSSKVIAKQVEYQRHSKLGTGKHIIYGIKKRQRPNNCELCGVSVDNYRLSYHHWDDSDLKKGFWVKGIWICGYCHSFVERLEDSKNYPKKYLELKVEVEKEIGGLRLIGSNKHD